MRPAFATEFKALVDELEAIDRHQTATDARPSPADAALHLQIECRLLELLGAEIPHGERRKFVRLSCHALATVRTSDDVETPGVIADLGAGGVFVTTEAVAEVGDPVELDIEPRAAGAEQLIRVRGAVVRRVVAGEDRPGLGVAFAAVDQATERRLRHFVVELLRKRL